MGLPGDPNDPNSPAGRRLYMIRKNARSASAASGALETGGHAEREANAVNNAIGNEYDRAYSSGFRDLQAMTPQLQFQMEPATKNPWAEILTNAVAPGIQKGLKAGTDAGLDAAIKRWFI
jgi:hypothetical protein